MLNFWYPRTQETPWCHPILGPAENKATNFDDNPIEVPVVISVPVLVPFVLWGCVLCRTSCKEVEEEKDDQRKQEQVNEELRNQEELDQSVQEYQQAIRANEVSTEMQVCAGLFQWTCFSHSIFGLSTLLDVIYANAQSMVPSLRC